jgi:integrase
MAHDKVEANPFAGILPPKKARMRKAKRRPFSQGEAVTILSAARQQPRASLRWLPWVLAMTGARLSEVCQDMKSDIINFDGIMFLRIHEDPAADAAEGEALRSVKNGMSIRTVPIHPALATEGFLDYVMRLPAGSPLGSVHARGGISYPVTV